jgi:hypothetical protein
MAVGPGSAQGLVNAHAVFHDSFLGDADVPSRRKADQPELKTVRLAFDRIETGKTEIAVLLDDDGNPINVPRSLLPGGARPGDVLEVTLRRDLESTRGIADETRSLQKELKATDPGGDLSL